MIRHKWGVQTPNGDFNPADVVDVFGEGVYIIMQDQFNKLPELRNLAPNAFILARFYLPNWMRQSPRDWAHKIWEILVQVNASDSQRRRNMDMLDAYTWANEQNLKSESGGLIGSASGEMIKPGEYDKIRDWNILFLDGIKEHPDIADFKRVFPALAMGNSDDQDDGAGVGLQILQPVIERCHYGAIHPYWSPDLPIQDEWRGLGRIYKQLPFFANLSVIVTETGNFAVDRANAPEQYLAAGYYMQAIEQIWPGFCFFMFADPTKQHQQNDMSRNTNIYTAIKQAVRIYRTVEWTGAKQSTLPVAQPDPVREPPDTPTILEPMPVINLGPQTTARKLTIGYQVWQWGQAGLPRNYDELGDAMRDTGALILADKYADADALQGAFDGSDMAVKSIEVMRERLIWCEDNGFLYAPWDVPRAIPVNGDPFEGAKQEALFHADVCNKVGLKYRVSDLEFYKSFFGYDLEERGGRSFFKSMQERNDGAELYYRTFAENSDTKTILQPDLRQWDTIQFHRLVPFIDSIVGQSYAYWFQTMGDSGAHSAIIEDFVNKSKSLELLRFGLCLYSEKGTNRDTPADLVEELCQQAVDAGAKFLFVYKAPINPLLHSVLKRYADTTLNMEEDIPKATGGIVPDDIQTVRDNAWSLSDEVESIAGKYMELSERARRLGYGWFSNGLTSASMSLDAASLAAKTATKAPRE